MRAAAFTDLTGPEGVSIVDRPTPEPGPGEARVDVEACAINRHDLWILEGDSAMVDAADLPFVSGLDVAGVVREVGDDVSYLSTGDRVVCCPNRTCGRCRFCREGPENVCERFSLFHGGLAEAVAVPADRVLALPDDIDATTAAALPTAYVTAFRMLRRADATPGDRVVIPGATGGVGVAAVQLATDLGCEVVGTSSSAAKLDRVSDLGLDHAIHATDPAAIAEELRDIGKADVVVNHLGGDYTELGQKALRRGGAMVVCGRTAGSTSTVDVTNLFLGHKRILGSTMGTQEDLRRVLDRVAAGAFAPVIDGTYPLERTGDAFAAMGNRESVGKLVVTP